ncbi:hypothetical protein [Pontibacter roseus]|uniref:hypothetical protein n=1 Tax=Pontibacter roseus TaxID=336989 RepID=UPI000364D008|nr:hypothetical protein [Pontibacter roseus]
MKKKETYAFAAALALPLALIGFTATAQEKGKPLPPVEREHILIAAPDTATHLETLSGIHLNPTKKGTFLLDFEQVLKEDAKLEVKNRAGKVVYQKPVSIAKNQKAWRYDLGKLRPDTYLVEVKTTDTVYWTKFKIGR